MIYDYILPLCLMAFILLLTCVLLLIKGTQEQVLRNTSRVTKAENQAKIVRAWLCGVLPEVDVLRLIHALDEVERSADQLRVDISGIDGECPCGVCGDGEQG